MKYDPLREHYVHVYDRGFRRVEKIWFWIKIVILSIALVGIISIKPIAILLFLGCVVAFFSAWALILFVIHARAIGYKASYAKNTGFYKREEEVLSLSHNYPWTAAILEWLGRNNDKKKKKEDHHEAKGCCNSGDQR